ncbi:hypothetical protein V495_02632 [Pseudogymnoascus sp. VKM F-4514 (FW-929)]|nr:hypothetical protein V495_02632 [Pseudogymnoascus sp. VKM F-4514 (FW-929)]KFY61087.1 hypothetical protein V497_03157 [Pseudogymnoascus sp. VKM F-4516 (FW-969)]
MMYKAEFIFAAARLRFVNQNNYRHPLLQSPPNPIQNLQYSSSPAPRPLSASPHRPFCAPPIPAHRGKLPDIAPKLPI